MPDFFLDLIKLIYTVSVLGMATYGLSCLALVVLFHFRKRPRASQPVDGNRTNLPEVTIQLPVFNERHVIARLIKSVSAMHYPLDKMQIQVLDDSTDETTRILTRLVSEIRIKGVDIMLIHRTTRNGYKAGALRNGLAKARGELIAIFDADFTPPKDWLLRTIGVFNDPQVGCVQTRWGFSNADASAFTRATALALTGHFIVEQSVRSENRLFLGFNGTAGIWRRRCIEDAGGWQDDTLVEDLDLSYRAQLRGWRIRILPDVVVPSILPDTIESFKQQQYRWAKGSMQTARKIYPMLFKAKIPEPVRLMGLIHLGGYAASLCMVLSLLTIIPLGVYAPHFFRLFTFTAISSLGPPLLYLSARSSDFPTIQSRLRALLQLILIGYGISLNIAIAVVDGLFTQKLGNFVRTPKINIQQKRKEHHVPEYMSMISPKVIFELILALIAAGGVYLLIPIVGWGIAPWLLLYAAGYAYLAIGNLWQAGLLTQFRSERTPFRNRP